MTATIEIAAGSCAAEPLLPTPRGALSEFVVSRLMEPVHRCGIGPPVDDDPLAGDDLHMALYCCYELHYRGFAGVDPDWEWEPSFLDFRGRLERAFLNGLRDSVP